MQCSGKGNMSCIPVRDYAGLKRSVFRNSSREREFVTKMNQDGAGWGWGQQRETFLDAVRGAEGSQVCVKTVMPLDFSGALIRMVDGYVGLEHGCAVTDGTQVL